MKSEIDFTRPCRCKKQPARLIEKLGADRYLFAYGNKGGLVIVDKYGVDPETKLQMLKQAHWVNPGKNAPEVGSARYRLAQIKPGQRVYILRGRSVSAMSFAGSKGPVVLGHDADGKPVRYPWSMVFASPLEVEALIYRMMSQLEDAKKSEHQWNKAVTAPANTRWVGQ